MLRRKGGEGKRDGPRGKEGILKKMELGFRREKAVNVYIKVFKEPRTKTWRWWRGGGVAAEGKKKEQSFKVYIENFLWH